MIKGIKVIDAGYEPTEEQFGTCELCYSWGIADNPWMKLEFPDGEVVTIDTYYWDWGNYYSYSVGNIVDFSAWLAEQEFTSGEIDNLKNGDFLISLIGEYNIQEQFEVTDE